MPKSVTTLCFRPYHLEEALDGAVAAGFSHVEICAIKGWTEHVDPDDAPRISSRRLGEALAGTGLTAVSIAGHGEMLTSEGAERHLRLLEIASEVGARYLNSFVGPTKGSEERARLLRVVAAIGDRASQLGVEFCLENDGEEAGTGEAVRNLVEEVGHQAVGIVYDAANAVYFAGARPDEDLEKALPWVRQVHVKDQRGGRGVSDFPPLGEGELDWAGLLAALDAYGYDGPRCLEIEFDGNWPEFDECVAAARHAREHWERIEAVFSGHHRR